MIVHILSLNDDDDDAKALPTGVPKDDAMKKGGWGGQNVSKSDGVILVCSLMDVGPTVDVKLGPQCNYHKGRAAIREHTSMAPSLSETFSPPHPSFPTVSSFSVLVGGGNLMT